MAHQNSEEVELAILFHNLYEKLAPSFGYETRLDTKSFNTNTPNGMLMIAVCKEIIKWQQEHGQEVGHDDQVDVIDLIQFLSMDKDFNGYGSVHKETAKYFLEQFKKQTT